MNLRHLRYFVAIAEAGSFVKAATALHISQPPLSIQIKELESELEAILFFRSPRGVRLTAAGSVFYSEALSILKSVETAKARARSIARGEEGTLRIGFVSIADYSILPSALRNFKELCPGADAQLHELTSDAQVSELQRQNIDVGIALAPVEFEWITFVPLYLESLIAALPATHPHANRKRALSLSRLGNDPFIFTPRALAPGLHDSAHAFCNSNGFIPNITQYAKQMQTVISLVAGGLGVALVPESIRHLGRQGVTYLKLREKSPVIQLGAIFTRSDDNPLIRSFLEAAKMAVDKAPITPFWNVDRHI